MWLVGRRVGEGAEIVICSSPQKEHTSIVGSWLWEIAMEGLRYSCAGFVLGWRVGIGEINGLSVVIGMEMEKVSGGLLFQGDCRGVQDAEVGEGRHGQAVGMEFLLTYYSCPLLTAGF